MSPDPRDPEVARKLFAVIRSAHFDDGSYISVGPLRHLDKYYAGSVFVVSDNEYNFDANDLSRFRTDRLAERIKAPIDAKLASSREHTKFERQRRGHLCKFLTALIQEFGALQMQELAAALESLGITEAPAVADKLIFCAKTMEWVRADRRGLRTFILPGAGNRAAKFTFLNDDIPADSNRRRFQLREYWSSNDEERSEAIRENMDALARGAEL